MVRFPENQTDLYFWRHKVPETIYRSVSFQKLMDTTHENDFKVLAREIYETLPAEAQREPQYDAWLLTLLTLLQTQRGQEQSQMTALAATLLSDETLTDGQRAVWQSVMTTPSPVQIVTGRAGAGKSYMMARLIKAAQQASVNTILLTPTHAAATNARGLVESAMGELLDEHEPEYMLKPIDHITIATATSFTYRNHDATLEIVRTGQFYTDEEKASRYPKYALMIIDEAFASNVRALIDAMIFALATESQILLVGDPNQLPSVENDPVPLLNALVLSGLANRTPALQQIKRANSPVIAQVANGILDGDTSAVMPRTDLRPAEVLADVFLQRPYTFVPMVADALLAVVSTIVQALSTDPEHETVALVPTNELRQLINQATQNALLETPILSAETALWLRPEVTLYPGDRVQVMQTVYVTNQATGQHEKVRLRGGDRIQVVDVMPDYDMVLLQTVDSKDPVLVSLDETSQTGFNPGSFAPKVIRMRDNFDLGYATTIHKIQGFTIANVLVVLPVISRFITTNLIYSAVTRAANHLALVAFPAELSNMFTNKETHSQPDMKRVLDLIE